MYRWSVRYYEQTYTNEPDPANDNYLGSTTSSVGNNFTKSVTLAPFSGVIPEGRKVYVIVADNVGNESLLSNVISFTISPS